MAPPSSWWGGDEQRGTPVVVKMDNPYSLVEIDGPGMAAASDNKARRGKNAKQLTWVLLLRAHRAVGCVAWLAAGFWGVLGAVNRRVRRSRDADAEPDAEASGRGRAMLGFLRAFLLLSLAMLALETVAHLKGWRYLPEHVHLPGNLQELEEQLQHLPEHLRHLPDNLRHLPENLRQLPEHLRVPERREIQGWLHAAYVAWLEFRVDYIAWAIQKLSTFCILLFMVQSVDRIVQCLACFWIKLRGIKPRIPTAAAAGKTRGKKKNAAAGDVENGDADADGYFPMVLVQMPMCNEKEVYETSISHVCQMDWPRERLLIQVLDDSDDEVCQMLIKAEVTKWSQRGVNIIYRHRLSRTGYKAGNLKSAMSCDYVKDYEFVAIFDADFQPNPDFLKLTVPHFEGNPELGLVQARWSFVNKDENLLTRLQNINLCFHFEVEQQVNGVYLNFFGFNGTAGVWRIKALEDSGGWMERTTVEDMDIAVRAHLAGWKFIFLNDVKVLCELPESYEAYRKQQHRWHSGPMQLFRLCLPAVFKSKIPFWKKANLVMLFFLLRKLVLPFYSFTLFCVILPLTMFVPEAELPIWVICYIPVLMSILNILPAPKSFPFVIPYLLFENTMSVTKFNAMVSGLFQLGSSYEWIVTKKAGRTSSASDILALAEDSAPPRHAAKLVRGVSEGGLEEWGRLREQEAAEWANKEDAAAALAGAPATPKKSSKANKKPNRIFKKELALAFLLLTAATRSLLSAQGLHFYFLLFQGVTFLAVGLDLIGEQAPYVQCCTPSSVLPSPQRLHLPASIPLYAFACLLQISLSFRRPFTHSLLTPLLPQLRLRRLPEPPLGVRGGGSSTHTEPHQRWLFAPGGGATATSAHPGRRRGGCCTPGGAASALYAAAWLSLPGRRRLRGGAGEGSSCVAAPPRGDPPPPSRPCRLAPTCGAARFHPRSSLRARPRPHAEIRCPHHGHAGRLPRAPPLGSIPGLSLRGHWCNRVHPM